MGIDELFEITEIDEVETDREHLGALWVIDDQVYFQGDTTLEGCAVTHAFASKTITGSSGQSVELYLKDKDMLYYPVEPNFRCWVRVREKPYISIATSAIGGVLNETDANVAQIAVALSEPALTELSVILKVQKLTAGVFKLRETEDSVAFWKTEDGYDFYRLTYKSGNEKIILVSEMDGTNDTLAGIDMSASVETAGWDAYYDAGSLVPPVRVQNVPPEIIRPTQSEEAYTNMSVVAYTPHSIFYGAKDVKADFEAGIDVTISVDGKVVHADKLYDALFKEYSVVFDGAGKHEVDFVFIDKDMGTSRSTSYFIVKNKTSVVDGVEWEYAQVKSEGVISVEVLSCTALPGVMLDALIIPPTLDGLPVTGIGEQASDCRALETIMTTAANPNYCTESGVLYDKSRTRLIKYPCAATTVSYDVPATVASIDDSAFAFAEALTDLTFAGHVDTIGAAAFDWCLSLQRIEFNGRVNSIGEGAFMVCPSLETLSFIGDSPRWGDNQFWYSMPTVIAKRGTEGWDDAAASIGFVVLYIGCDVPLVPNSWINQYPTLLAAAGGDYEVAANSIGDNCVSLRESYVAGLDPTNKTSRFVATIKMGADGKPILSWKPPLNGETEEGAGIREGVRKYRVFGKRDLVDDAEKWEPVAEGDESGYRFFKVKVEMP